jgi:hypothetical protein
MVDMSGEKLSQIWRKTLYVAYEDVLKKFDNVWCVKNLIVTHIDLVVTWKVRPWIAIIS